MTTGSFKHYDAFGRLLKIHQREFDEEKYLKPSSGKLVPLVVQQATTKTIKPDTTHSPLTRLSQWAHSYSLASCLTLIPLLSRAAIQTLERGGTVGTGTWRRSGRLRKQISPVITLSQWAYSSPWAWIPSCFLLLFALLRPDDIGGTPRYGGYYDPVRAFDRQYATVARNRKEGRHQTAKCSGDSKRGNGEYSQFIPQGPRDIEMGAMTPFTSTTTLVRTASQSDSDSGMFPFRQTNAVVSSTTQGSNTTRVADPDEENFLERSPGPSYLCFLTYDKGGEPIGYETRRVDDWVREHGDHSETEFVFLSYTRAQFNLFTAELLDKMEVWDMETRKAYLHIGKFNRATLEKYGMEAAHQAGKRAFWWDVECIKNADNSTSNTVDNPEVYTICDVVRAAHSMVILVGPLDESKTHWAKRPYRQEDLDQWLAESGKTYDLGTLAQWMQDWGSRLWTFPEILLIPPGNPVKVCAIGGPSPPEAWAKRNFASRSVWADATHVRQLIDHYESTIHLKPLELLSLALECFPGRKAHKRHDGDSAYAMMGLLRRRPMVDVTDSEFTAFARLSLANNSESLLERLICLQPLELGKPWHYQKDFWGSKLWDIEPRCQIAGIADHETVILDGAYGATIQWDAMRKVYFFTRPTLRRTVSRWLLRGIPLWLATVISWLFLIAEGVANLNASDPQREAEFDETLKQQGPPAIHNESPWGNPSPDLAATMCDFWDTQASFVGMEGIPADLGLIEEYLFGSDCGRLQWNVAGSMLSRHKESEANETGACIGLPPLMHHQDENQAHGYGSQGNSQSSNNNNNPILRTFTIIDTFSMTAIAFQAARPPTAVIVCGREGGMQRAALCSYDWKRNTFAREQVIRLKTTVLDRMSRMERFRFSLKRRCDSSGSSKQTAPP
ncbi:hypothetical protein PG989_005569 [Apiospora arundinis]